MSYFRLQRTAQMATKGPEAGSEHVLKVSIAEGGSFLYAGFNVYTGRRGAD